MLNQIACVLFDMVGDQGGDQNSPDGVIHRRIARLARCILGRWVRCHRQQIGGHALSSASDDAEAQ